MDLLDAAQRLALALAIGLLVGIERGWREREKASGTRTAGIRTYALTGLLGGLAGVLYLRTGALIPALLLSVYAAGFTFFQYRETRDAKLFDFTGVTAAFLVLALGVVAVTGNMTTAAAGAVAVTVILFARKRLHAFLEELTGEELRAGLILLSMTVVALPLLPREAIDPWGVVNPYEIWMMTILIAAISCTGYLAIRLGGATRGALFAGAAGGLASSTATTLSLARFAKAAPRQASRLAGGAAISGALSIGRVVLVASLIAPALAVPLALALLPAALVFVAASALLARSKTDHNKPDASVDLSISNPLDLALVLRFGALLGAILAISQLVTRYFGALSVAAVAAVSGLADVDAITLATARMAGEDLSLVSSSGVILTAVLVNLIVKAAIARAVGGEHFGKAMTVTTALAITLSTLVYGATAALGFPSP